jgi:tripartite-type tricarboxylate transporter receptor subunit TctC
VREVVFRQYPLWLWLAGLATLTLAAAVIDDVWDRTLLAVIGMGFIVLPSTLTVTVDRGARVLALHYRSLFRVVNRTFPLTEIASVDVGQHGERMYRVQLVLRSGEIVPLQFTFSVGKARKERAAERLRGTIRALVAVLVVSTVLIPLENATAQAYPSRPITMVVPFAAGGPVDTMARLLSVPMGKHLGQSVLVDYTTGASGTLGVGRVVRAAPDGYTLSIGHWSTHVINGAIYPLQYDLLADLQPLGMIATNPMVVVAGPSLQAQNLSELIAWLKANPDKASLGTAGVGSGTHMAGLYFQNETGTRFEYVPYRGSAPALQDLLGGRIQFMVDQASNSLPQIRGGKIRAYAVTAKTRLSAAPEIPTVDQAGLPGFYIAVWYGIWAPKGTPRDVVAKLNGSMVAALADPTVRQRLADLGQEIPPREQQTPEGLAAFQKAEIEKWWPIVKAAGIKPE